MQTVDFTNSKTNTTQEDNSDNEALNEVPSTGSESYLASEVFNEYWAVLDTFTAIYIVTTTVRSRKQKITPVNYINYNKLNVTLCLGTMLTMLGMIVMLAMSTQYIIPINVKC